MDNDSLQTLRNNVLQELTGLTDYLATDDQTSYDLLIVLARNTGNALLLEKAFTKIQAIEDPKLKSDALVELLDEVEIYIAGASYVSEDNAEPHENRNEHQEQPNSNGE